MPRIATYRLLFRPQIQHTPALLSRLSETLNEVCP